MRVGFTKEFRNLPNWPWPNRKSASNRRAISPDDYLNPMTHNFPEKAKDLAFKGFSVLPLKENGKKPLIRNWKELATTRPDKIDDWGDLTPNANVGIVTGTKHGVFVIDVDDEATFAQFCSDKPPIVTLEVKTPHGKHLYFKQPEKPTKSESCSGLGFDVLGDKSFVVAPLSIVNGKKYEPLNDLEANECPEWLLTAIADHKTNVLSKDDNQTRI